MVLCPSQGGGQRKGRAEKVFEGETAPEESLEIRARAPQGYVSHMTACTESAASASMMNTMVIGKVSGCPLAVVRF